MIKKNIPDIITHMTLSTNLTERDVLAVNDFSKEELLYILEMTEKVKSLEPKDFLHGKILGNCFFEPSTRTRLSFESAMIRSSGSVIGFSDHTITSTSKGESLHDTMKMMEAYADIVVIRHPLEGAAQLAADAVDIPVINAGDGSHQHPTQTILDLYSILESQGTLEGLHIALVGDLKYGRTVHSLAQALTHFGARLYFVSPQSLEMPKEICDELRDKRIKFSFHHSVSEIMPKLDIIYMTRVQKERFSNDLEFEKVSITLNQLDKAKSNLKILHPLPRVDELDRSIDETSHAYYFEQARNGLYTRQTLLGLILGKL